MNQNAGTAEGPKAWEDIVIDHILKCLDRWWFKFPIIFQSILSRKAPIRNEFDFDANDPVHYTVSL